MKNIMEFTEHEFFKRMGPPPAPPPTQYIDFDIDLELNRIGEIILKWPTFRK